MCIGLTVQVQDLDPGLIELFADGKEDGLPDAGRLDRLGLGSGSVVLMLRRLGWRWGECGSNIALSGEGLVATKDQGGYQLVTGGSPMTAGRHYWEVELTWTGGNCNINVGAVRPGLDHDKGHFDTNDAYYIYGSNGSLWGNGLGGYDEQGKFAKGDHIGVLLDLDAGWLRIYRNGNRCGPGFVAGVTGPLVRAAEFYFKGEKVTALPGAVSPEGAGLDASSPPPVVDNVSWTICCMDGATFSVAVPEDAPVAALKRGIGEVREVPCFTMELFVKDVEEPLDDEKPLRSLDRAPLFLLLKQASDRLALEALFKSTGGAGWTERPTDWHWMTDADLGEWHGVGVDLEGRVTWLELGGSGMAGPIPSDVLQLSALQSLVLDCNELTGPIPAVLGQLGALTGVDLAENQLSGPIPAELGQLAALNGLDLANNQLSGLIPAELGQLAALNSSLRLGANQLSGLIPAELGQLRFLPSLELYDNQLTGPIPVELGQLGMLTVLWLDSNQLSGPVPAELGQLTALTELNLGRNQLTGLIPAELGQLGALTGLYLGANQLSGPIPEELGQLGALTGLYLGATQLTGQEAFREYMEEHHPDCELEL